MAPKTAAQQPTMFFGLVGRVLVVAQLIWSFSESDFPTFVIPNTTFAILGVISGRLSDDNTPSMQSILFRLPLIVLFNWYTVLIFEFANQRCPESVKEDQINKPWRPIPSGRVTPDQVRRAMLIAIPAASMLDYCLGIWKQGVFIRVLTWMYNDLRGGDEVTRDTIIAVAYGLFNVASLQLAVENGRVNQEGYLWAAVVSCVILTTMQVQDLKDQEGDRTRRRRSLPLLLGDGVSRVSIVCFMVIWSFACSHFWHVRFWIYTLPLGFTAAVASCLMNRTRKQDARAWRMWCFWTMTLYSLPVLSTL